jgi:hypothetical protein
MLINYFPRLYPIFYFRSRNLSIGTYVVAAIVGGLGIVFSQINKHTTVPARPQTHMGIRERKKNAEGSTTLGHKNTKWRTTLRAVRIWL